MENLAHSILGPSGAERWLNCSASVSATKDLPDIASKYAAEGTAAHTVSEWCRDQGVPASTFKGRRLAVEGFDFLVTDEMVDAVQEFVDRCAEEPGDALYEARVSYENWVPGGFGTSDDIRVRDGFCKIVDLKYGTGVQVYAERNPQLMLYALGVYSTFGWLYAFDKFVLAICQPRLHHYDEFPISLAELLAWANEVVRPGALKALSGVGEFNPGEWCSKNFCKIRGTCRKRAEYVMNNVVGEFEDLDAAAEQAKTAVETRLPTLTNDEIAKALRAWPSIQTWGASLKAHAAKEIMEGRAVGNFKFVDGRSNRSFIVGDSVVVEAAEELGAKKDELYSPPELLSVAQIEKIVGATAFAPEKLDKDGFTVKKEAGPMFALIKKTKGAPTLVPGEDKREAVSVNPTDVFSELGDE